MEEQITILTASLRGIRPILFDRYAGKTTKLPVMEKFYANENGMITLPVLNIFSLLSAQNTPSVAKRFYGKQGRDVALGILSFVEIEALVGDDVTMSIPLLDENDKWYKLGDTRITTINHIARLKDGVPNDKERPMIPTGWKINVKFIHHQNEFVNVDTLKRMIEQGGILGLGTFRPIFGRYVVDEWRIL